MRQLICVLFVLTAFASSAARAGYFSIISASYSNFTNSAGGYLVKADAGAEYIGRVDSNDKKAVIWTSLNWEPGSLYNWNPPDLTGPGKTYHKPFYKGQRIWCTGGCTANKALPKAPCGEPHHIKYLGRGQVVIPHPSGWEGSIGYHSVGQVPCSNDIDPCEGFDSSPMIPTELVRMSYDSTSIEPLTRREGYTHGAIERREAELFTMDSWAVVGRERVASASGGGFARLARAESSGRSASLLVEAPVHPPNHRWVPRPSARLEPGGGGGLPSTRAFARVEFNPDGSVYSGSILSTDARLSADEVGRLSAAVKEAARIDFATSQTHRAVAYFAIDSGRRLSMLQSTVVLLRCRCGGP